METCARAGIKEVECGRTPDFTPWQFQGKISGQLGTAILLFRLSGARTCPVSFRQPVTPVSETHFHTTDRPTMRLGEPASPPVAPVVCNAIFAATGIRVRKLPFTHNDLRWS